MTPMEGPAQARPEPQPPAASTGGRMRAGGRMRGGDERGTYAVFIAVITSALLLLGSIGYDGPRLNAARQDALHTANEAARVAAATIASGGTVADARQAAQQRVSRTQLIYGEDIHVAFLDCVGSLVRVTVITGYVFRTVLGIARPRQPIEAIGAAEARLVLPSNDPSVLNYLGECPL